MEDPFIPHSRHEPARLVRVREKIFKFLLGKVNFGNPRVFIDWKLHFEFVF